MSQKYVCIEGNIGSGKTTFTKQYAEITGATAIYEQFSENPFLESFYKNPAQNAFPLEMSFLSERFQQLNKTFSKPDLFATDYIADYTFLKTLMFAKINLKEEEYALFKNFYSILNQKLRKPDLIVYLHTEIDYVEKNIQSRGRSYENLIQFNYLKAVDSAYKNMLLRRTDIPIIIIPYSATDWKNIKKTILDVQNILSLNTLKNGTQFI
jgi:deoxyadenosine/deoxycytidine kinase